VSDKRSLVKRKKELLAEIKKLESHAYYESKNIDCTINQTIQSLKRRLKLVEWQLGEVG